MKELMLRLRKDGEIVGYMLIEGNNKPKYFDKNMHQRLTWDWDSCPEYESNSFDMGFKFQDEWFFEGDKVNMRWSDYSKWPGKLGFDGIHFLWNNIVLPKREIIKAFEKLED